MNTAISAANTVVTIGIALMNPLTDDTNSASALSSLLDVVHPYAALTHGFVGVLVPGRFAPEMFAQSYSEIGIDRYALGPTLGLGDVILM